MLNYLLDHIPPGAPRSIPKYKYYLERMRIYTNNKTNQYLNGNSNSYPHGMRLLDILCHMVDLKYMNKFSNDVDRYMFYISDLRNELISKYDTTHTGSIFRRYYISGSYTKEFVISNEDLDTLQYLPFNSGWDIWKDISVMKVWWHDSDEFSLNLNGSRIRFYDQLPSQCIFLIDPIALIFKWYKFKKEGIMQYPDITSANLFFYKNFIYNTFQSDLTNIWLMKQLRWLINIDTLDTVSTRTYDEIEVENQYGKITTTYTDGMLSLFKEFDLIKHNNTRAINLLNTDLLFSGSLRDLLISSQTRWYTDHKRPYMFLTILKEIDIFELIFNILKLNPKNTLFKTILVEYKRIINRLKNNRPWTNCKHHELRDYIEIRILSLHEKIYNG